MKDRTRSVLTRSLAEEIYSIWFSDSTVEQVEGELPALTPELAHAMAEGAMAVLAGVSTFEEYLFEQGLLSNE